MKIYLICLSLIFSFLGSGQSLNGYKYIQTPKQFSGFSEPNQYRLNSYARSIIKQNGFQLLPENPLNWPEDALNNPCIVLMMDVNKEKSVFKNKLSSSLTNCKNEVVVKELGISSIKEFEKGYQDALKSSLAKFPFTGYFFNEDLVIQSELRITNSSNPLSPPTTPQLDNVEVIKSNNIPETKVYKFNNQEIKEELISDKKVLFVLKDDPNVIVIKGTASSIKGIYNVLYTQEDKAISTIGYFEEGNWVMDLPNKSGVMQKTIFKHQLK